MNLPDGLTRRAAVHAALGDPVRLAIVQQLASSDRSPKELSSVLGVPSNLLAHHLDTLEHVGLIARDSSAGDRRRKYVRLLTRPLAELQIVGTAPARPMLFLCSHNSARSQLAAALWTARTGGPATSAGTHPAARVHRGAVAAARRAGLRLDGAVPRMLEVVPDHTQVVTVCDRAYEELRPEPDWWHWSIPDPVESGDPGAFDAVVHELDLRITAVTGAARTAP
jgi:protein-tyrosine-phosphatase